MQDTIKEILSILEYIIYRNKNIMYEKFLNKEYDYSIEYISPIKVTIIPKVIYILTDNIQENRNSKILDLYISLLYNIHNMYHNNIKIYTIEHNNMNIIEYTNNKKEISIIRGNTLTLSNDADFEIWIYVDQLDNKNDKLLKIQAEPTSDIIGYRIIIAHSNSIKNLLDDKLSIKIYV